ncbi:MAG TPA: hypothetical protein VMY43_07030 [Methanothrix sp.]|nr:hypothetical protein [Methanothrix sp.]
MGRSRILKIMAKITSRLEIRRSDMLFLIPKAAGLLLVGDMWFLSIREKKE